MTALRRRQRVLVVDDAAMMRRWMELKLGDAYDVSVAADGDEAVTVALTVRPDLILLDVEMPRLDGFATCRALRSQPVTRRTPIILVTSRTEPSDVETGFACGCTDFIAKPVDEMELAAKVESWVVATDAFRGALP
jgi:CheY-like chemotaxis protein